MGDENGPPADKFAYGFVEGDALVLPNGDGLNDEMGDWMRPVAMEVWNWGVPCCCCWDDAYCSGKDEFNEGACRDNMSLNVDEVSEAC